MKKSMHKMSMIELVDILNGHRVKAGLDPIKGLHGTSKQAAIIKILNAERGQF